LMKIITCRVTSFSKYNE